MSVPQSKSEVWLCKSTTLPIQTQKSVYHNYPSESWHLLTKDSQCCCTGVVRATHAESKEFVAIKIWSKHNVKWLDEWKSVKRELELNSCVNHPFLCRQREIYEDNEVVCAVFDFMSGGDLFERGRKKKFSEEEARRITKQLLGAVHYLHTNNIAHRDIKPENIVFESKSAESNIKLIDFGHAKRYSDDAPLRTPKVGTTGFAATELELMGLQFRYEPYTAAVDLFSVGVVLYFTLYGRSPFYDHSEESTAKRVAALNYMFPNDTSISFEAKDLISKFLHRDPNQRPSATEAIKHPWFTKAISTPVISPSGTELTAQSTQISFAPVGWPASSTPTVASNSEAVTLDQSETILPEESCDPRSLARSAQEEEVRDSLNKPIDLLRNQEGADLELKPARESALWKKRMQKKASVNT